MKSARLAAGLLALGLLLVAAGRAGAKEVWSRGEASLDVTGSIRSIATVGGGTDAGKFERRAAVDPRCVFAAAFPECSAFDFVGDKTLYQSLTRFRLRLDGRVNRHLSAVIAYDHELLFGTLDTLGRTLGEELRIDPLFDLDWEMRVFGMPTQHREWRHGLYRAYAKLELGGFEASAGRQRIPWGVGRLWNPTDRFNAIPPLAIEQDQIVGVDALDARWNFDGFTFLEAVYQPNGNSADAAYGARFHGSLGEADYSFLGGRWEEAWAVGGDLATNVRDAAFRMEAIWTRPRRDIFPIGATRPERLDDFWQLVASLDYSVPIGNGLYLLVEHLYNENDLGFGEGNAGSLLPFFESTFAPPAGSGLRPEQGPFATPGSVNRFGGSRVITSARNQTGFQAGYELTPSLRVDMLVIYDWDGHSAVFSPILAYSPLGSLEITLGGQLFAGKRRSQYGSQPDLGYAIVEWFF